MHIKNVVPMYNVLLKKKMDAYQKSCAHVQCTVEKRWMQIKKCCANVQCTVDKRWMHTKKVALKDGCAQAIVALLYNVRDEKYG